MTTNSFCSWQEHKVPIFAGQYDTNKDTGEDYDTRTLGSLWGMAPTAKPKAKAPAFIPSTYNAFDARNHAAQREHGQFVALTGDIDEGNLPIADVITYSRVLLGSAAAIFIYSTGSATHADKRWRIIAPLKQPVPFERWNLAQEAFFNCLEARGVPMDRSLARAAQPVYLPNIPPERWNPDGKPVFYEAYLAGEEGVSL